ncbi:MAG: hypothetical protein FWG09_02325 [Synergistaceae bacterium]|nr:hypothetical protein [Synergistaceae bacterium]
MKKIFCLALLLCIFAAPVWAAGSALLTKIDDVGAVFDNLRENEDGRKAGKFVIITVDDWPDTETIENHIQGIAYYNGFYIFSNSDSKNGKLVFVSTAAEAGVPKKAIWKDTPLRHPGGIQVIGDYLLVGAEGEDGGKNVGKILLYDLTPLNSSPPKLPEDPKTLLSIDGKSKASTVGVADIGRLKGAAVPADKSVYVVGVTSGSKLDLYSSNQVNKGDIAGITGLTLQTSYDFSFDSDYNSIALFSGGDDALYFIGFRAPSYFASYRDIYDVYQLTDENGNFIKDGKGRPKQVRYDQYCLTIHEGLDRFAGVHFRWGAGIHIESGSEIVLFATDRNRDGKQVQINIFAPADGIWLPKKKGGGCDAFGFGLLALISAVPFVRKKQR